MKDESVDSGYFADGKVVANDFIEAVEKELWMNLEKSIEDLFTEPFEVKEVFDLISAFVKVANEFFIEPSEENIRSIVMDAWNYYNEKYNLVSLIDNSLDCKKVFGRFAGTIIEGFDEKLIVWIIEEWILKSLLPKLSK